MHGSRRRRPTLPRRLLALRPEAGRDDAPVQYLCRLAPRRACLRWRRSRRRPPRVPRPPRTPLPAGESYGFDDSQLVRLGRHFALIWRLGQARRRRLRQR